MVPSKRAPRSVRFETRDTPKQIAPADQWIAFTERFNVTRGHENAGFLSRERGFLPRSDPKLRLASSHRAWDEAVSLLPELYEQGLVRRRLAELPLLSGGEASLGDEDVLRGAALLAILSHAYWYCLPSPVSALPEALARPWRELRARLGRAHEVITYIDLVVYNWRRKDPSGPLEVSNLSLLFPTIGNQEEQVFYLTQLEILARSTDLIDAMISAQSAVLCDDVERLTRELGELHGGLERIVRVALPKISGQKRHPHFIDAVTWAKTVAPFAVPFRAGIQGPSGTSSPIFNTLDLFFGRHLYESFLGREIRDLRGTYPRLWRGFLRRVARVDVASYVRTLGAPSLSEAWESAIQAYAGSDGFLGRHRMKVYGFLELAFKVGRSITIGGFGGAFQDRTWDEVDDELESSRNERPDRRYSPSAIISTKSAAIPSRPSDACYLFSEIAQHNSEERGYWVAIASSVYDLTRFRALHPGGERILDAYAGMDATHGFERVHLGRADIATMLARYRIGALAEPALCDEKRTVKLGSRGPVELSERLLYRAHVRALNLCVEMQNALGIDLSFSNQVVHPGKAANDVSPYQATRVAEAHERFLVTELGVLLGETLPRLEELTRSWFKPEATEADSEDHAWIRGAETAPLLDARIAEAKARTREIIGACEDARLSTSSITSTLDQGQVDLECLTRLKGLLTRALQAFEGGSPRSELRRTLLDVHRSAHETLHPGGPRPNSGSVDPNAPRSPHS